jgi:hypothetical protein
MVKCKAVTIEEEELGFDSIANILKNRVNGAKLEWHCQETDKLNEVGDKVKEYVGIIRMVDGTKKAEIVLNTIDLIDMINYMIHKMS